MLRRIVRDPQSNTPQETELFVHSDNIDRNEQAIQQTLNQITQIEAQLPPAVVQEVRQIYDDLVRHDAERERLIDKLADLQDKSDDLEGQNEHMLQCSLLPIQRRINDRHEPHQRILQQLSAVLSELSDQLKRYEDQYGPLD